MSLTRSSSPPRVGDFFLLAQRSERRSMSGRHNSHNSNRGSKYDHNRGNEGGNSYNSNNNNEYMRQGSNEAPLHYPPYMHTGY